MRSVSNIYFPSKGNINYQADVDIICGFNESVTVLAHQNLNYLLQ